MDKPRILVIDDDLAVHQSLKALLAGEQYDLEFAANGPDGLEKAERLRPDVILLDVMIPSVDGFEVCYQLRTNPVLAEAPILMMTASGDRDLRLLGLEKGADDFLFKPIDKLELRTRLRTITRLDRYRKLYTERSRLEIAVKNLENSHFSLQKAYDETIEGWARVLDMRDKEIQGHSKRVRDLTISLAYQLDIPEDEIIHISRGALLHDLGKIALPDVILRKPGQLTDTEWAIMRKHPTYAFEMLSPIEYLRPALEIPYCHHEKWDGSGYPRGLRGTQIPRAARIFAVVDVWDACRSNRPYRPALSDIQTLQYIQGQSGAHFEPQIVEMLMAHVASFEESR